MRLSRTDRPRGRRRGLACALLCAAVAAFGADETETATVMEDLRLPFEHYDDGRVKVQLMAGVAYIPADGPVRASEVRLEFYDREGKLESVLSVDSCEFDREDGTINSGANVRFARTGISISGRGCELDSEKEMVRLFNDVRVVLSYDRSTTDLGAFGVKGSGSRQANSGPGE